MADFQNFKNLVFRNLLSSCIPLFLVVHLILFTIFTLLYYKSTKSQLRSPESFETEHFSAVSVACLFPISGQYGQTPLYAFYFLIGGTIVFRKHKWVAAAVSASALTYSGVAAIHNWLLFSQNDRISLSHTKSYCQPLRMHAETWDFLACNGVMDPDIFQTCNIVGTGLLASIPMALWSKTFQSAQSRPILIMWMILMSSSHIFCVITTTDSNCHYQICPADIVEQPPGGNYLAVENNDLWREQFINISTGNGHTTEQNCIYSCFASTGYIGRTPAEIGVYPISRNTNPSVDPLNRKLMIAFWTAYTALGVLSMGRTTNGDSNASDGKFEIKLFHVGKPSWYAMTGREPPNWCVRVQSAAKVLGVLFSIGHPAYAACLRIGVPKAEGFSSVRQWSVAAVMCLTLFAVLVARVAQMLNQRREAESTSPHEEGQMEDGVEDSWGHGVGYAS